MLQNQEALENSGKKSCFLVPWILEFQCGTGSGTCLVPKSRCSRTILSPRSRWNVFASSDFEGPSSQNTQTRPSLAFDKGFSKVLGIKPESSYAPLCWIWPSFFHISCNFCCDELRILPALKGHYIENTKRYDKTKTIYIRAWHLNSLVWGTKIA